MKDVPVRNFFIGKGQPLALFCGPCVIENEEMCLRIAEEVKEICDSIGINYVFKSSYDKANRSSINSYRGPGIDEGLRILERVRKELDVPILTDVHDPQQASIAGHVCDIIQIPAFLCRQTDLLVAAAKTPAVVNVKKGQFMAPWDMGNIVEKIVSSGNEKIILIDRGVSFGYNNLVSDMRSIPIMQRYGYPVCFDATHSVQLPGACGTSSGGQREFIGILAKAAVAVGVNSLYMEAHTDPKNAKSDAASQIDVKELRGLLTMLKRLYDIVNE